MTRPHASSSFVAAAVTAACAVALLSSGPSPARADLSVIDSLEWSVANADAIHDGLVGAWRPIGPRDYFLSVVTPHPVNRVTPIVVRAPDLLLQTGEPGSALEVGDRVIAIAEHSEDGHRLELRRLFREGAAAAVLRDGTTVSGMEEIGARTPDLAGPGRFPPRPILLPLDQGSSGDVVSLRVPADRPTELMLRGWLEGPDFARRVAAAGALAPFESSANIMRLQGLLDDRTTLSGNQDAGNQDAGNQDAGNHDAGPLLCLWAARTLRIWEVAVAEDRCGVVDHAAPDTAPPASAPDTAPPAGEPPEREGPGDPPPDYIRPPWGW